MAAERLEDFDQGGPHSHCHSLFVAMAAERLEDFDSRSRRYQKSPLP